MSSDRIEKTVVLTAPLSRVWHAISDSTAFGTWFGLHVDGPFVAGADMIGRIVPTQVDPDVAKMQEAHRGTAFHLKVEAIEPMRRFSFRWHPYAVDAATDYSAEPMTLVTFTLAEQADGVLLTITEEGFDRIPASRRDAAREANAGGWAHQTRLIARYLERNAA